MTFNIIQDLIECQIFMKSFRPCMGHTFCALLLGSLTYCVPLPPCMFPHHLVCSYDE